MTVPCIKLLPDLLCFRDTCNVYVVRGPDGCLAVDFGSGKWLPALRKLKWGPLQRVYLTHHHADQCHGLLARKTWPFEIHAPRESQNFLASPGVDALNNAQRHGPVPASYDPLPRGLDGVRFDVAGWRDQFWGRRRLRFLSTPGHGPDAVSMIIDVGDQQIVFCGDAAHDGATIWQPYHLEWDHWTATGTLAAIEGVKRLRGVAIDLLCPSHGPVIRQRPRAVLAKLQSRMEKFADAKGNISPGEPDRYLEPSFTACGAAQLSPHLYQFGSNSYLLLSESGEALVVDPFSGDLPLLDRLLAEIPGSRLAAAVVTHCHADHVDGAPALQQRGIKLYLHPHVAPPLAHPEKYRMPWLPRAPITADARMPMRGSWQWNEYQFQVAPFPGQTWWHAAFMTTVDGRRALFAGDSFQPASRWNGTGGFCAYNASSFRGFIQSSRLIRDWRPTIVLAGHTNYYRYAASKFSKIERWARRAEQATRALCPAGKIHEHYTLHRVARL